MEILIQSVGFGLLWGSMMTAMRVFKKKTDTRTEVSRIRLFVTYFLVGTGIYLMLELVITGFTSLVNR